MLRVTVDTADLGKLTRRLELMARRANDLSRFMDDASAYMANVVRNRLLRTKRGPDGEAWAPLSQTTIDIKGSSTILFETGELARSISDESNRNGFIVSAGAEWAPYMHCGVKHPRGHYRRRDGSYGAPVNPTPARPFMGFSQANVTRITKMLRAHLAGEAASSAYGDLS